MTAREEYERQTAYLRGGKHKEAADAALAEADERYDEDMKQAQKAIDFERDKLTQARRGELEAMNVLEGTELKLAQAEADLTAVTGQLHLTEHQVEVVREELEAQLTAAREEARKWEWVARWVIERISLTPERWNGWTTDEVLSEVLARYQPADSSTLNANESSLKMPKESS